jgi:hypothetical protein
MKAIKPFTVLEVGDYGCIFKEEIIDIQGQAIVFRYSQNEFVVECNVKYHPYYEERHFASRNGARNFARNVVCNNDYIFKTRRV